MNFKLTEMDKKITEIVAKLYLRYYNFADIFDYINGEDILEIFYKRLDEHIKIIPRNITNTYNVTKEQFIKIIKSKDIKGTAILKFKLNDVIERYKNRKDVSHNIIKELENDIEEIDELLIKKKEKISFSEEEKNSSRLYKILKNQDYEKLKIIKLDIRR